MPRTWTTAQENAITLHGRSLLVSAAAGSGKTSVLTERVIRDLTDADHPADITKMLIVTFTRAAAAELKSRIAAALWDKLAEHPENTMLSEQLLKLGSAEISTIDSFFMRAVREHFDELGLPASFRIADEHELTPLKNEVLDGLIEDFYRKNDAGSQSPAMERIRANRFAKNLDHLLSNRSDGKLNSLILAFREKLNSDPDSVGLLRKNADSLRADAAKPFPETTVGKLCSEYVRETVGQYLAVLRETKEYLDTDPVFSAECEPMRGSDENFCVSVLSAVRDGDYQRIRETLGSFVPGRFSGKRDKPDSVILYKDVREKFKKDLAKLNELFVFSPEEISRQMKATAELCTVLFDFYTEYDSRLLTEKRLRGVLEYSDLRTQLSRLLTDDSGSPTPLAAQIAARYDAVCIDEYQDVDPVQDRIFSLIGGDKRFMVGDIKQSIYGFRGSEPSIFAFYRRSMPLHDSPEAEGARGVSVFMSENFRCDKPVIDFANLVCSFLFSACEESVGYRAEDDLRFAKSEPPRTDGNPSVPVNIAVFEKPGAGKKQSGGEENDGEPGEISGEALWVASEISRLLNEHLNDGRKILPGDIVILLRSMNGAEKYADALRQLNIPVCADRADNDILTDPLFTNLVNLLRVIDNPYRDLPLSEYLLSALGGFTLEELETVREEAERGMSLYEAMENAAKGDSPLAGRMRGKVAWIEKQRALAAVQSADRFLRLLYQDDAIAPLSSDAAALFLYDEARIYQRTSFCGLFGFLEHLTCLIEGGKADAGGFRKAESSVSIITAHRSKGLEFPVVFLCGCGKEFNHRDAAQTLVYHRSAGCGTKLYNEETAGTGDTVIRQVLAKQISDGNAEENIRVLYVALTRARERLYVTGSVPTFDTAMKNARLIRRGDRNAILGAGSFLTWILAATGERRAASCDGIYRLQRIESGSPEITETRDTAAVPAETPDTEPSGFSLQMAEIICKNTEFAYPLDVLRDLPTKAAASKLRSDLLDVLENDADEDAALEAQIDLLSSAIPGFDALLNDGKKPKAADIGTATHAFLEFCDFSALRGGIGKERERLVANGFLSRSQADILHLKQLERFRDSDLLSMILAAKDVRREQKFSLSMPMSGLTSDTARAERLTGHTLFVQGSIDLLLTDSDGRRILVDYKTDAERAEERNDPLLFAARMAKTHGDQLSCYARAVKELFGNAPDKIYIYSLPRGELVPVEVTV